MLRPKRMWGTVPLWTPFRMAAFPTPATRAASGTLYVAALLSGYLLWSFLSSGPPVYRSRNRFWYQTVSFCSIISFLVLRCHAI